MAKKWNGYQVYSHDDFKSLLVQQPKAFYVYILLDGNEPIYVGKGTKKVRWPCQQRALQHEKAARNKCNEPKSKRIRRMLRDGRSLGYVLHFGANAESTVFFHEQVLIAAYGKRKEGGSLYNRVDGGQGMSGYKIPQSTRNKMSATRTGRKQSSAHNAAISRGRLVSENVKRANELRKIPVLIQGTQYTCVKEASEVLNVCMGTLKYRISTNWPGYERA
jgi:hypothetical protein